MLGHGAYGTVTLREGKAVKTFHKVHHLLQEWIACSYLQDTDYVVKASGFNLEKRELYMTKYDTNLDDWLAEGHATSEQKWEIFKCILKGLTEIHGRGLVHGDIKPDNILLDRHPLKAVIGDLGFTSLAPYAKVRRTARPYRDWEHHPHAAHDINSLGILAMRLFAGFRPRHQSRPEEIASMVRKQIVDPHLSSLILRCTQRDYRQRPSAAELLEELFSLHTRTALTENPTHGQGIKLPALSSWLVDVGHVYALKETKRGSDVLCYYLSQYQVKEKKLYTVAMLILLSSLFGRTGFSLRTGVITCKEVPNAKLALLSALTHLVNDRQVVKGLLHSS